MVDKVYPAQSRRDLCGAWIVSVNMGYGHQRTAYPLSFLAPQQKVINANDYQGIPRRDKVMWETMRGFYEAVSRFSRLPFVGRIIFSIYDQLQKIASFYPKRDMSRPNFSLWEVFLFMKEGWGRHLMEKLTQKPLPLITTFFTPAFMAEFFGYPGEIFCVVCDADISRTWAPLRSKASRIKYFAPTSRAAERLQLYGVKKENIFLTGYPLPPENIGSEKLEKLKEDLKQRLVNLDPQKKYFAKYQKLIEITLGNLPEKPSRPLTILFSVGGAGAQKETALKILKSLKNEIKGNKIKIILSAGTKAEVKKYFEASIKKTYKKQLAGDKAEIIFGQDIESYFQRFNTALRETDILWTKPSELSFYSALGIPLIIAPPIGSQEQFNMRWLLKSGFGMKQENLKYISQWLFDWLNEGYLAEAAMQGFVEGEKLGTYNIQKIISSA